MSGVRIVLASSSPRRRDLLTQLGLHFEVRAPEVDESPLDGETPESYAERLALAKAAAVATDDDELLIAADTVVVIDGQILGKPADAAEAAAMLGLLSDRTHQVVTAVALARAGLVASACDHTLVTFEELTEADIAWYVATGEPLDKAGAYAIQGAGELFVTRIAGSVSNVVGLPLALVRQLATRLGVPLIPPFP